MREDFDTVVVGAGIAGLGVAALLAREAGEKVLEGIRKNSLYIFSHGEFKDELREIFDEALESLPEEKIEEFAHSEHFDTYKKLFEELGLV